MSLSLRLVSRSGKELTSLSIGKDATVDDLKKAFYAQFPKYYPDRQYFTIGNDASRVTLSAGKKLSDFKVEDGATVVFKDLGPQIAWKTVFHVEYFGPILFHALPYFFPALFYSQSNEHNYTQKVAFWLVILHYVKRELETHYVHRFSNATMPFFNIFKNSAHYWLLGGLFISYFLYHPMFTEYWSASTVNIFAVLFIIMELGNLQSHIILRNLRPPGTRVRAVPRGWMFEYTTCANYTFEVFAWLVFSIMVMSLTSWIFLIVSTGQIALWSIKKHVALKKEFPPNMIPKRKILFPFIW